MLSAHKDTKKTVFFSIALFMFYIGVAGCGNETVNLTKGQTTPSFNLPRMHNGSLRFPQDLKDNVIAIRFWADWCSFCKTEMRDIEPVYQKYKDQGLVVLAINVRQDQKTVQAFIKDLDISYDVLLDKTGKVARSYGVSGLPISYFIGRDGTLHTRILGESTPEVFETIVKALL